jgi:hypothetical protein
MSAAVTSVQAAGHAEEPEPVVLLVAVVADPPEAVVELGDEADEPHAARRVPAPRTASSTGLFSVLRFTLTALV